MHFTRLIECGNGDRANIDACLKLSKKKRMPFCAMMPLITSRTQCTYSYKEKRWHKNKNRQRELPTYEKCANLADCANYRFKLFFFARICICGRDAGTVCHTLELSRDLELNKKLVNTHANHVRRDENVYSEKKNGEN